MTVTIPLAADYRHALQLLPARVESWRVPVRTCSALQNRGIAEAWQAIADYVELLNSESILQKRRADQEVAWMWRATTDGLIDALKRDPRVEELEKSVRDESVPAGSAAREIIDLFLGRKG